MDCGGSDEAPPGLEERFRYPGPKPKTREAAVVMLADSIEAATRTLQRPNKDSIEAEIAKIVRAKIEDGQFDNCSITFRDIKGISDAFLHVLEAMMHGRVSYPSLAITAEIDSTVNGQLGDGSSRALSELNSHSGSVPVNLPSSRSTGADLKLVGTHNFQAPEEFYASFGDEPAEEADTNVYPVTKTSGKSAAAIRTALLRGSQHSVDG
jgi:hypothetical protein